MTAPNQAYIQNAYTRLMGIEHPVVQEGMGPFETARLAAAVSNAGGLGTVSVPGTAGDLHAAAAQFRGSIEKCATLTDRPFAVNVPVGHSRSGGIAAFAQIYIETMLEARRADSALAAQLRVITTSAGFPTGLTAMIHDAGMLHQHKVGATRHAVKAAAAGVDAIVAAGLEMGGHAPRSGMHSLVLLPNVADAVDVPVVLSGGVRDGRGLAAAICLGAEAVALGTRFAASTDNPDWHPRYAERVVAAGEGDDLLLDGVFGPCRVLRNAAAAEITQASAGSRATSPARKIELMMRAQVEGDTEHGLVLMGQVASGLRELISVAEFVPAMAREAAELLHLLPVPTSSR